MSEQKEKDFSDSFLMYKQIQDCLKDKSQKFTEEQKENFQYYIDDFEERYLSTKKNTKQELTQLVKAQKLKRSKSVPRENVQLSKKPKSQRSSSADDSQKKKKQTKNQKQIAHYKKNRPKKRPEIVYEGKTFRYKTQLVKGPQLACQFNASWHPAVSCKMYLNLGKNVYGTIAKNPKMIDKLIDDGYIIKKNEHSAKEDEYIQKQKEKGQQPGFRNRRGDGPKPYLGSDAEDESDDTEEESNLGRVSAKPLKVDRELEDDYDEDEEEEIFNTKNKMNVVKEENSDQEDEEDLDRDIGSFKINPVSSLKKPTKTSRVQFDERAQRHVDESQIKTKKDFARKPKQAKKEVKKKAQKKQTKKYQKKKATKKPQKLQKVMDEEEVTDIDQSSDSQEDDE